VVRGQPNEINFTEVYTKFKLGRLASEHITSATKAAHEYAKFYLELLKDEVFAKTKAKFAAERKEKIAACLKKVGGAEPIKEADLEKVGAELARTGCLAINDLVTRLTKVDTQKKVVG